MVGHPSCTPVLLSSCTCNDTPSLGVAHLQKSGQPLLSFLKGRFSVAQEIEYTETHYKVMHTRVGPFSMGAVVTGSQIQAVGKEDDPIDLQRLIDVGAIEPTDDGIKNSLPDVNPELDADQQRSLRAAHTPEELEGETATEEVVEEETTAENAGGTAEVVTRRRKK